MDNNLISNILQLERTNLIRGGTGNLYASFELKLQLHGQVSNPYTVSVKKNYKASTIINVDVPAYTEKSWTTPGTYTWTVPAGVTRVRVAVCGGGGGGAYENLGSLKAGSGGTSSFDSLISATGGTGAWFEGDPDGINAKGAGIGGSPNGYNGAEDISYTNGFALNFTKQNGSYGRGGGKGGSRDGRLSGGSGGYNSGYFNIISNQSYNISVGAGGYNNGTQTLSGTSGFVLIAYGQGIE